MAIGEFCDIFQEYKIIHELCLYFSLYAAFTHQLDRMGKQVRLDNSFFL